MDTTATTAELLASYGAILTALRERGVIRTENSPVGDVAEWLAARAFGLELAANSGVGWDGRDAAGVRYQIKSRRITRWSSSRQLGTMRGLDGDPFDVLLGVLFDEQCAVTRAALIPIAIVRTLARRSDHVNGSSLMLRDSVWLLPGVVDVTDRLRAAAEPDCTFGPAPEGLEPAHAPCDCGCGAIPIGAKSRYLPGHDLRHAYQPTTDPATGESLTFALGNRLIATPLRATKEATS